MDTIKTLVIEPLRRPELRDIDPTITAIGKTIGGYAEPLPLDRRTTLWCDEEGAIRNLKPNRTIRLSQDSRLADAGKPIIIRGTFVITGPHPQDGPLGLDDEQIGRYAAMFADPEAPCRLPRRQNVHDTRPPHRLTHGQGVPARANQAAGDGLRRPGEGPRAPPGPPRAGPSRRPRPASVFRTHAGNTMDGQALSEKGTPPKGRGPRFPFSAFSAEAETIIPASRNPSNRHADGLRPARSIGRNPLWPVTLRLTERPKRKNRG